MIEAEIQDDRDIWTYEFLVELNKRMVELENGEVEGSSWEEARARKFARDKRPDTNDTILLCTNHFAAMH